MNFQQAIALVFFASFTAAALAEPIVDVSKIAGKTAVEVTKVLGKPSGQEKTKYGPKILYKGGKIEVVFIGGKADWLTVSGMESVPFTANAIEALGLKAAAPTFKNDFVMRWEPHRDYHSVSIFNAGGQVDYAYVKVATK